MGKWEKARSQLAEKFRRRVGMRLHREHPRRPRREKQDCLSNERSSRGTNQDDKPKIGKTGQRLTKQVLSCGTALTQQDYIKLGPFPPVAFYQHPPRYTPGKSQVRITEMLSC